MTRLYPDQIKEIGIVDRDYVRDVISGVLQDNIPEHPVNEWFIDSVHFANMVDKIVEEIFHESPGG